MNEKISFITCQKGLFAEGFCSTCEHFWCGEEFCAEEKFSWSNQLVSNQAEEI